MEIKKIHFDNRGEIYQFDIGDEQHILVTYKPGIARGGHYHKTNQMHICLAGNLKFTLRNMGTGVETIRFLKEGDSLLIPKFTAHLIESDVEAVMSESRIGDYEAIDFPPYREKAKPR